MKDYRGYHDCPCRDCFDVAIGGVSLDDKPTGDLHKDALGRFLPKGTVEDITRPALCNECEEAGCDADGESDCARSDAYGCDDDATPDCPACGAEGATLLGTLGPRTHYRCRACGIDFSEHEGVAV